MTRTLILFLLSTSLVFAEDNKYWETDIPIMAGATNISSNRNERFYVLSTSYEVELAETESLYKFYENFFEKMGWENPMKNFPKLGNNIQGSWNSFRTAFNSEDLPESSYASMWKATKLPAVGTVNLTLTNYNEGKFKAKVKVTLSPEVDTSPIFELQNLIMGDPRNIFILHKATGGNPLEFDKVLPVPEQEFKNDQIVIKYYKLLGNVIEQYREFGSKYVQR